jgi:hypothetical protein
VREQHHDLRPTPNILTFSDSVVIFLDYARPEERRFIICIRALPLMRCLWYWRALMEVDVVVMGRKAR